MQFRTVNAALALGDLVEIIRKVHLKEGTESAVRVQNT
jgi:hypothetical protein